MTAHVTAGTRSGDLYHFGYTHIAGQTWAGFPTRNIPDGPRPKKTVPVIGVPIGGTSVVSAVLDGLGVMMGDPNHLRAGGAFEDAAFQDFSEPHLTSVIEERNQAHNIWGFKNPRGVAVLKVLHLFRNPYCVFVFRDPVASAHHYARAHKLTIDEGLETFHNETEALYQAMMKTTLPSLLVSHERVRSTPEFFIQALIRFLAITPTVDQWVDALGRVNSRGGYLAMPREFGRGPGNEWSEEDSL